MLYYSKRAQDTSLLGSLPRRVFVCVSLTVIITIIIIIIIIINVLLVCTDALIINNQCINQEAAARNQQLLYEGLVVYVPYSIIYLPHVYSFGE